MSKRTQFIVLSVLLAAFAITLYFDRDSLLGISTESANTVPIDTRFTPLDVDNPALRMDIMQRFLALEYKGVHRNIFSATLPPPPMPPAPKNPVIATPPQPTGPPPLTVDAKFFGYVSDFSGSHRKAFFITANNEDVIIAAEGDTLMGRFRVDRITNTTADLEEVSSGRHTTLTLEEPGPTG
jgi:hypothetical protein